VKNICMIGVGYVGLVTGACLADLGNRVTCLDVDEEKIERLRQGVMPIYEPGLEEIVRRNASAGRLDFTTDYPAGLRDASLIFIAVGTPSGVDGEADLDYVQSAAEGIAAHLCQDAIIINKSTVPIGTGDWVAGIIERHKKHDMAFAVVSNPEFLREGSGVHDFMSPDRVVLGSTDRNAAETVAQLYLSLQCPILITDLRTAEMIKYASNAFLATKISFINEISSICERLGADVKVVARGMGLDKRIGPSFLDAGIGWGGSCFPKDVKALTYMAEVNGCHPQLLKAVSEINRDQRMSVLHKLRMLLGSLEGKTIGVLGLSYKPNTDDMRDAPAVDVIKLLRREGAAVRAFDPVAMSVARKLISNIEFCANAYEVAQGADALVVLTEWNEFKQLDMSRIRTAMKQPILIDGRNIYQPEDLKQLGFTYRGVGRGY
jgi:UDPglucose 6-dehydrogenase